MKKGNATYFYHYNAHGDVIVLTDAQGNIVARYQYDAWGNILSQSGSLAGENPYRYAGYQYDQETGLYYLIARYYHPEHGVFLSLDPDSGDADDILTQNGHAYANNNPVMLIDPDGHFFWFAVNAGFAAMGIRRIKPAEDGCMSPKKRPSVRLMEEGLNLLEIQLGILLEVEHIQNLV